MPLETWSSKPHLEIWILLSHPPQQPLWCIDLLKTLAHHIPVHVVWLNNGLPIRTEALIQRQELRCSFDTIVYPLALSPAEIFAHTCCHTPVAATILWIEDRVLVAPERVLEWLKHIDKWPAIYPHLAHSSTHDQRLQQEPSYRQSAYPLQIVPLAPEVLPPCLLFPTTSIPLLKEWNRLKGQMILWFPGCDQSAQGYIEPVGNNGVQQPLGVPQALGYWQEALLHQDSHLMQRLAELYPHSPMVYLQLARWSKSAADALNCLHQALSNDLFFPDILHLLYQAWLQLGETQQAAQIQQYCLQRFPDYVHQDWQWPTAGEYSISIPDYQWPVRSTLSVTIITANEALLLPDCLASVADIADEIIVADTGSTDQTVNCAHDAGVKVMFLPWCDNFAAIRNQVLEHVQSEWVLVLDADERLTPEGQEFLQQFLWNNPPGLKHFAPRMLNLDDSGQIHLVHRCSRLFPHHPSVRFHGRIHEYVISTCRSHPTATCTIPLDIIHLGYQESLFRGRAKAARNYRLLQLAQSEEPQNPYWPYYLAIQAQQANHLERALELLNQALTCAQPIKAWETLGQDIYSLHLQCLITQGRYADAEKIARTCQQLCLNSPDYWYNLGFILKSLNRLVEAAWAFEHCLSLKGQVLNLQGSYHYFSLDRYPLLGLMDIYWLQTINRALSPSLRLQALKRLLDIFRRLWAFYPEGTYNVYECNLYILFGKACIWGMTYHLESSLLGLFDAYLLPESCGNWRFQVETVLLFFDGQLERCQERLAGLAGFEDLRDLRENPPYLLSFARILWEKDTENALIFTTALLSLASSYYQDASFEILLIQLHEQGGLHQTALNLTLDIQHIYPHNPYLYYQAGRLFFAAEMWQDALKHFERATELKPDFDEAWPYLAVLPEKMG